MRYRHQLRGWRKALAVLRRRPWRWDYVCDIELGPPVWEPGKEEVSVVLKQTGPMRKEFP